MFHQLKDFLQEFANGDPIWSDFEGPGDSLVDYTNGDQKTTDELEMNKAWKDTGAFGKPCVQMTGDDYKLESAECSSQARFICVKDTCPEGFTWFDHKSCIKLMNEPRTKSEAETLCKEEFPRASLFMPTTQIEQATLEGWLKDSSITSSMFLGAQKVDNQWVWDDGGPIFMEGSSLTSTHLPAIDGQILGTYGTKLSTPNWIQIDLPKVQLIPQVKLFIDSV